MEFEIPIEGALNLEIALEAITKILDNRLVQRQHGVLRRSVNARILIEFIRQIKSYNKDWLKRKRTKESLFRRRRSADSERIFEQEIVKLRQKVEVFAEELAAAVFMVWKDFKGRWEFDESAWEGADTSTILPRSFRSRVPSHGSSFYGSSSHGGSSDSVTCPIFEAAFRSSVEAALRGEDPKRERHESAERRLGNVFMALWTTAHV